ncbi:hypothetical protein HY734_01295 [Candidatus Uhrbacteria bacterium]|nr:hypothetical protein [Candidatus Uhrbacteria bacterium]
MDPVCRTQLSERLDILLSELDERLKETPWCAGSSYSLGDAVWTVFLNRLAYFRLPHGNGMERIEEYYARLKVRPIFARFQAGNALPFGTMAVMYGRVVFRILTHR